MPRLFQSPPPVWLPSVALCAGLLLIAAQLLPDLQTRFLDSDNDDILRLVMLRDLLAGQSWFDLHQYRLLPPGGVEMHWSRYVDGGLALLQIPAGRIFGAAAGETLAVALWPLLLGLAAGLLSVGLAQRHFGTAAGFGAALVVLTGPRLVSEFLPGRIDHHNLQILCAIALFCLWTGPAAGSRLRGAVAGAVTALSLAVGLEMLPFLALIWGGAALRQAWDRPGSGAWLTGFVPGISLAAPLLMMGQTPPGAWGLARCDVLATPLLALIAVGSVATLAPVLAAGALRGPGARSALLALLTLAGFALAWPLLGPCAAGPYASIAPETREIIDTAITEGLPLPALLQTLPATALLYLLPPLAVGGLGAFFLLRQRATLPVPTRDALLLALVALASGFAITFTQVRASSLMAPVLPFLTGFVLVAALRGLRGGGWAAGARAALALATLPLSLHLVSPLLPPGTGASATAPPLPATGAGEAAPRLTPAEACRQPAALAQLRALPEGAVIFSSMNFGALILLTTPHSATSAPYHRSNDAFWNGIGAFRSPAELATALQRSGATHLMLCPGISPDQTILDQLDALTDLPLRAQPLPDNGGPLRILNVTPGRLPDRAP